MIQLSDQAIKDIRFDAEQNCIGASVGDTLLLLNELKRAKAELELAKIEWQAWRSRAEAQRSDAEVADKALREDAQRYRWLCDGNGYFMEENSLCGHSNEKQEADAAIDAAMRAQGDGEVQP